MSRNDPNKPKNAPASPNTEGALFEQGAQIGPFRVTPLHAGDFRLDGGAMFGVVPKTLWSRVIESDAQNRIPMTMRSLLVQSSATERTYLIDTGAGTKFSRKLAEIYDLPHVKPGSDPLVSDPLLASLSRHGISPDEITDVIFTHLHFDHCGGATRLVEESASTESNDSAEDASLELVYPNATHHVSRRQWISATSPNDREKASFLRENLEPLHEALERGQLILHEDHHEFEPGFDTLCMNGHTAGQWLPRLHGTRGVEFTEWANRHGMTCPDPMTLVHAADLIPLSHHVPLPWVMAYDMNPITTLDEKKTFLMEASQNGWTLFLEHDREHTFITVEKGPKGGFVAGLPR